MFVPSFADLAPQKFRGRGIWPLVALLGVLASSAINSALAQNVASAVNPDEAAIRKSAADFVAAFKRHDAKAIAQMWTADGDYVDEAGQRFAGRDAIENEYTQFFREHPDAELRVTVGSVRLINPTTTIEDGTASLVPPPAGPPTRSKYIAIHAKQADGGWLLASVRDSRVEVPTTYGRLETLELFVGDWGAEHAGTEVDVSCRWNADKSFLERRFTVTRGGETISTSTEIIGWDPAAQQITSWTFSSGGGRAIGRWTPLADGWVVENQGLTADGTATQSVAAWAPLLDGALGWRSTQRSAGGAPLKDTNHVVLTKKVPADASK